MSGHARSLTRRQLIIYAKRVLSAFSPHAPLISLSLPPSLASSPPPPAVIVVLAFVLSARNVMRNCLCVLGVYDIIFVFLSVRLPPTLCVCLCVCKLHYTTSNITNDNKHLADTTRTTTVTAQQKQFHKNVFFFCLRLPPQACIMLYNLLMTLLMTVIATALGTAQIVVHSTPLPTLSYSSLCLLPLPLWPFGTACCQFECLTLHSLPALLGFDCMSRHFQMAILGFPLVRLCRLPY